MAVREWGRTLLGCLMMTVLAACGTTRNDAEKEYLFDQLEAERFREDAGWDVLKEALPAFPTASTQWIEIGSVNSQTPFRYFVDADSVSIAPGHIVRYTLRSVSDRGAVNQGFESIRCGVSVWKTVAIGGSSGWERARNDEWRPIERGDIHDTLRRGVLCSGGGAAAVKVPELLYRLKHWERYNLQTAREN